MDDDVFLRPTTADEDNTCGGRIEWKET